jgi:alpha/beta superfamily hydrolase
MEKHITFASENLTLEGLYTKHSGTRGAIITHPHPLYGGDMSNPVVEALVRSYNRKNITTLRFNFRGTGRSEGRHEGGLGERQDILAAINFLVEKGITSIQLVGYSFGSWVIAHLSEVPTEVEAMIFISPPIAFIPFQNIQTLPLLQLVITGEEDEFAPPQLIRQAIQNWNPNARFEVIDATDHFYYGSFNALENIVEKFLS